MCFIRLGEVVMPGNISSTAGEQNMERLACWLGTGNVIYKSVGLGLMDLSVGLHMIQYAQQKGVGTQIQGF